jgi:type II secretory pathway pseudopilin PulG
MYRRNTTRSNRRAAFTLLELVVAMAIILFIAGMVVTFLYATNFQNQNGSRGAEQLQGWLLIAKQRALRDGLPRGVRLLQDPSNPQFVTKLQYIEQPDDYTQGYVRVPVGSATGAPDPRGPSWGSLFIQGPYASTDSQGCRIDFYNADVTGGSIDPTGSDWLVQPGDLFDSPIAPNTPYHVIVAVVPPSGLSAADLAAGITSRVYVRYPVAAPPAPNPLPQALAGTSYRIIRAPRPQAAEPDLLLPKDVVVDLGPLRSVIPSDNGHLDILFSPQGSLLRQGQRNSKIILWVRDITLQDVDPSLNLTVLRGDQILVVVYGQTGLIAAHPADPDPTPVTTVQGNPYSQYPAGKGPYTYTLDGRSSGL